jgi:hypothetical protein
MNRGSESGFAKKVKLFNKKKKKKRKKKKKKNHGIQSGEILGLISD